MENAFYTSSYAVTDFIEAIGIWVDESLVNWLLDVQYFSLMAKEFTDIATTEKLSIFCRWEENGSPVEHIMEILPLKRCNAESIYSILIKSLKKARIQCQKMVGIGFDGASTFAGTTKETCTTYYLCPLPFSKASAGYCSSSEQH